MKKGSKLEVAKNYAQALYQAALDKNETANILKDAQMMRQTFSSMKNLALLNSPLWDFEAKKETISEICRKIDLSETAHNFVLLLAENRRLEILPLALEAFEHIYYQAQGVLEVRVESVQPLSATQIKKLEKGLQQIFSRPITAQYHLNPDILGGLIVQCGSTMIDDSIKGKLNRLEQLLKGNM